MKLWKLFGKLLYVFKENDLILTILSLFKFLPPGMDLFSFVKEHVLRLYNLVSISLKDNVHYKFKLKKQKDDA